MSLISFIDFIKGSNIFWNLLCLTVFKIYFCLFFIKELPKKETVDESQIEFGQQNGLNESKVEVPPVSSETVTDLVLPDVECSSKETNNDELYSKKDVVSVEAGLIKESGE